MFLTQSIRSKLVCMLAGVLVMLGLLSGGSVWGLMAYRSLVTSPSIDDRESGSAAEVLAAVTRLKLALLPISRTSEPVELETDLSGRVDEALTACGRYRLRLDELPQAVQHRNVVAWELLRELEPRLRTLRSLLARPQEADLRATLTEVAFIEQTAAELPETPDPLKQRLKSARATYRSGYAFVVTAGAIATALLFWMVRFGYRHVFQPIHALHQGARRVAQGDFDYRVPISSPDEVGELADAFNLMTERFQEIATNLDGQVKARSQQLVRSERLASVGFLAAGVAHEINNPLTAIRWTSESLEQRLAELLADTNDEDTAIVQRYLRMIQSESERCQEITRKLLDFSRGQDTQRHWTDVASIVREVVALIGHMKRYRSAKLIFEFTGECRIEINGHEIKQVMLNLVANALDATDGVGTVQVSLAENVDDIELCISDNGCGMSPETIENLFQPFFTTKPTGEGTGLGLSISHRIVTDHGGRIEVHSDGLGLGSTFIVRLPRSQRAHISDEAAELSLLTR